MEPKNEPKKKIEPQAQPKKPLIPVEDRVISEKLKFDVFCGICCLVITEPRQCLSGHAYCGNCVAKCIAKEMPCPSCRRKLTEDTIARNLILEEYSKKFLVHCQYHYGPIIEENSKAVPDPLGCTAEVPYDTLEQHEKDCKYSWIRCPFTYKSETSHNVRKFNWQTHKEICEYRPAICKYCDACFPFSSMNNHEQQCPASPVPCSSCGVSVLKKNLVKHKEECKYEPIKCPFHVQGCTAVFKRELCEAHLSENQISHLLFMQTYYDQKLQEQQKQTQEDLNKLKIRHKATLDQVESQCVTKFISTWQLRDYSTVRNRCFKKSEPFSFLGFSWFIGCYFFGDNDESKEYLSVYLFSQSAPQNQRIKLAYTMTIVNHDLPELSVAKGFEVTFPIEGGQGWGDRKVIKHRTVKGKRGFLKKDTLSITCNLQVNAIYYDV